MDTTTLTRENPVDFTALKAKQQAAWSSGDYAVVGTTLQIVAEQLCEAMDLPAGSTVLDVAAGNGAASLAAARRWGIVTSTDYVASLLARGKARAMAEGLNIAFQEADAEALPFAEQSFDAVISTFGVMFAPDHDKAAAEMLRVLHPGGTIGLANWTPDGFIGEVFKVLGKHLPPAPGAKSPMQWGTHARIKAMFGPAAADIRIEQRHFNFRYLSPKHFLDVFETYYGPMLKAFETLDVGGQAALRGDLMALINRANRAKDGSAVIPSEYLEIVITKR